MTRFSLTFCAFRCPLVFVVSILGWGMGCASLPTPQHKKYDFPADRAFRGDVAQKYQKLGLVRTQVNFPTLDAKREEEDLCANYYNKAVQDLVARARDQGGDAVIDVKSVVFYENGGRDLFQTPECSDDGAEGQILTQGIAVRWLSP